MEDAEHDDRIGPADEEDAVWESLGQHAANLGVAAQAKKTKWVLAGSGNGGIDFSEKVMAEAGLLLVIPDGGRR